MDTGKHNELPLLIIRTEGGVQFITGNFLFFTYNDRAMNKRLVFVLLPVVAVLSFFFGWQAAEIENNGVGTHREELVADRTVSRSKATNKAIEDFGEFLDSLSKENHEFNFEVLWEVWKRVEDKFVDISEVTAENLIYGATKGLVEALDDPYTVFMTPEETIEFQNNLDGTLEGIGAELAIEEQMLTVVTVLKDSPAEKNKLQTGDVILEIEGKPTSEMTIYEAITKIRGEKGTKVKLLILRRSEEVVEPFDVVITRDTIRLDSVEVDDLGDGIFHVGINQFTDRTKIEFQEAVTDILLKDPKGLVLDLRFNGGGYLDVAVDILSEFIDGEKLAVKIARRNPVDNEEIRVGDSARLNGIPLAVLVNGASASASEIVAGAIQDHKKGVIIGEVTFGKGSVQEVESINDGSSLRITIAKWLTPNGRSIDDVGINPDIEVELTEEDLENNFDRQLEEAINYLKEQG